MKFRIFYKIRHLILIVSGFALFGTAFGMGPEDVIGKIKESVTKEASAQKKMDKWVDRKNDIRFEIENLRMNSELLKYQIIKYRKYIEKQKKAIKTIEEKRKKVEKIKMELEPFLDKQISRLETSISKDLPFLQTERKERLRFLKESLEDYKTDLSEKLRRILEGFRVESDYGKTLERTDEDIITEKGKIRVNVLRVGRIALFYRSLNGKECGMWDRKNNKWFKLPSEYNVEIEKAEKIASRKRTVELVNLPLGDMGK